MPLEVQCNHCGRALVLDTAFVGAACRCRHCRNLMAVATPGSVPNSSEKTKTRVSRPAAPTSTAARTPVRQSHVSTAATTVYAKPRASFIPKSPGWLAAFSISAAVLVSVPVWIISSSQDGTRLSPLAGAVLVPTGEVTDTPELLKTDPLTHYFGIALTGNTIGYVVDGDATMAPYIDQVAFATNTVNAAFPKGSRRFGVVQAVGEDGQTLLEVSEPANGLEGARTVLQARLPSGKTDLSKAMSVAANWYADQIFLVVSKPLAEDEIERLKSSAEQTSAVVNVIAVGGAASQDLSSIAEATEGQFVRVSDSDLAKLVQRQQAASATE